jgi:FAD/FMN-containing dehydrogenase
MQERKRELTDHDTLVAGIARRVKEVAARGEPVHIQKGGVHHFVPLPGDKRFGARSQAIDVSPLRRVLSIDAAARTCTAEPGVTFAECVRATLPHGLLPKVVPELEGITLGGAVAGCSVESMSYRYGGFHDTCLAYEVVTGAGEVVSVSRERDADVFHMIHGSYGTLGILTKLTFELVPAKPYVRMEYRKLGTFADFDREMRAACASGAHDFIDGIIHGPDEFVLCIGQFTHSAPYLSSYRWLDIYYKSTSRRTEDYLTTEDYCFRYDTECHWLTRTIPPLEWKPVRFALGKIVLGSTNLIKWSGRVEKLLALKKRPDVVVDVFIPGKRFADFFAWYEKTFDFYPLWIVPYRVPAPYPWISDEHAARMGEDLFIDCAVYGKKNSDPAVDLSQVLEEKTYELGGIKTLISRNHHTRERFWQIFSRPRYDAMKARLDPRGVFKNLYDKFHVTR